MNTHLQDSSLPPPVFVCMCLCISVQGFMKNIACFLLRVEAIKKEAKIAAAGLDSCELEENHFSKVYVHHWTLAHT